MKESISNQKKVQLKEALNRHWKALLVFAIIAIAAGIACLISPNIASINLDRALAIGLVLSSIPLALIVLQSRDPMNRLGAGIGFLVSVVIGSFLLKQPVEGVITIGIAIFAYFIIHGIYKIVMSFKLEDFLDRGMALLSGAINVIAAMIILKFSEDSKHNPEALAVGVGLIFSGIVWARLALRHRNT